MIFTFSLSQFQFISILSLFNYIQLILGRNDVIIYSSTYTLSIDVTAESMCHFLTVFPFASSISFQCMSSSSLVLSLPIENQPRISFRRIFLMLMIENMKLTLGRSNSIIWNTNVSLYSGSNIDRRIDVLLLESCCPTELNIDTLTYVSGARCI